MKAWRYLENGGRHAELIWHRRSGKDDISLNFAATQIFQRPATYWHMLPQANQARKAIWDAINPHTGVRRIDEAFPRAIRKNTRENEMMIVFLNGSTWQVVGSDNYNSLVGSPPAGVVYSEWALANPSAKAYLRPILMENKGWQVFISTPRGKNHAFNTYNAAKGNPNAFCQTLTARDTGILTLDELEIEKQAYIDDFGEDYGLALFKQEWWCDWTAAIMGAYYSKELASAEAQGRITTVEYDPSLPVWTAWDIGKTDDTSIWFFQVDHLGPRCIDFESHNNQDVDFYVDLLIKKPFPIEKLVLPHDAKAQRLGMKRTVEEQFWNAGKKPGAGWTVTVLPPMSLQDGIQAARHTMKVCRFDAIKCHEGIEALKMYRREWDTDKKCFKDKPVHDWTSHPSDGYRYLAMCWKEVKVQKRKDTRIKGLGDMTINDLWSLEKQQKSNRI